MSTMLMRSGSELCGLVLAAATLLYSASAHAAVYTPKAVPDAIEQASSTAFGGATFVHLTGVSCAGRSDGFFVIQNNGEQSQQVDLLLSALRGKVKVVISHDPNCTVQTVGICGTATIC